MSAATRAPGPHHGEVAPAARSLERALRECEPGEVLALLIPYQRQADRARAIDHFDAAVTELRAAGWQLETSVTRCDDGEIYAIEPTAAPNQEDETR